MRKGISTLAVFMVFGFGTISYCVATNSQTWTGYVTDTHCGTHCQMTSSMKPDLNCIRICIKKGSKYGLWSGNHVYELEPQVKVAAFAAKNVKVQGTLVVGTIQITSIESMPGANDQAKH